MTDIVAKLLDFSIGSSGTLRTDVAAEIERLRDQLATSQGLCTQFENAVADDLGELLGLRAELDRLRAASEWRDIRTAPRDELPVELWHRVWACPVTVQWKIGFISDMPWIEKTKTTAWPMEAFSHWRPATAPPQRNEVAPASWIAAKKEIDEGWEK